MPIEIKNDDFVAAVYSQNSQIYVGSIIEFDDEDALISSMERGDGGPLNARSVLKWPTPLDEVWIARRDILCLIPGPFPTKITASRIGCKLQEAVFGGDVMSLCRNLQKVSKSWKTEPCHKL